MTSIPAAALHVVTASSVPRVTRPSPTSQARTNVRVRCAGVPDTSDSTPSAMHPKTAKTAICTSPTAYRLA